MALAGGPGQAHILVLPMASSYAESGPSQAKEFRDLGADAHSVELDHDEASLPASTGHLEGITGIWFTGGDQSRLTAAIGETLFEEELHRMHRQGLVLGGRSAGAAIMSPLMITGEERPDPGDGESDEEDEPFDNIIRGRVVAVRGFGFLPGTIVDQHFVARRRNNRLLSLVLEHPGHVGVGIDERTALEVDSTGIWRVLGESVAIVYDAREAQVAASGPLGATGIKMHVLRPGSTYDPVTGQAVLHTPRVVSTN